MAPLWKRVAGVVVADDKIVAPELPEPEPLAPAVDEAVVPD